MIKLISDACLLVTVSPKPEANPVTGSLYTTEIIGLSGCDSCCVEVSLSLFQQGPQEEFVQEPRWRPGSLVLHYRPLPALGVLPSEEMLVRRLSGPGRTR